MQNKYLYPIKYKATLIDHKLLLIANFRKLVKVLLRHFKEWHGLFQLIKLIFYNNGPCPTSFRLFSSFQTNIIAIFTTNKCEKFPSSKQCWDSNPQPLEHESPPITTRPGLPQTKIISVLKIGNADRVQWILWSYHLAGPDSNQYAPNVISSKTRWIENQTNHTHTQIM